ncbi:ferrous iron transport protein B [Desulfoluna spongiiphila]|uniref:Ferrous iron transport protein B n=1 Tax=Desulfoluna spongiiphila TaxID=419481 RepID=A0A1G5HI21_9BACT|nr:ferrous iron transport protein B [Desulfoluna spongiiphila]SCY63512.1 ferrous iron transport protein B [Desulfoluna spongiiphila]
MDKHLTLALAGNPNSGKTTMYNSLTGARQRVGNYPGITVEHREGDARHNGHELTIVDLPGTYSLTAYTPEELVARDYIVERRPHAVVNILDATSLERNLYLSLQFMELGVPVVLALNMMDAVRKQGKEIDTALLSKRLGLPVVETVARTGDGKHELMEEAVRFAGEKQGAWAPLSISYGPDLDPVIDEMVAVVEKAAFLADRAPARWVAIKYLENDEQVIKMGERKDAETAGILTQMADSVARHCRSTLKISPESLIADYRYGYIAALMKEGVVRAVRPQARLQFSDQLDKVLTQQFMGPAIMIGILYTIFYATFTLGEIPMGWVEAFFAWFSNVATAVLPEGMLQSLVVDGIIGGVGGVLGFVPLIMVMFMMIAFLEDSGYMARMAYMMDRVMRAFGLHGSSVMPFIVSGGIAGGCAVPGVMATRTLRSPKEKLATVLTAPFMSCGAKVPVIILIAAAFFENSASVMFWTVLGGWAAALVVAKLLRSTVIKGESTPFVMELPPYRMPTLKGLLIHTWERAWSYIKKAGTVILGISILIWAMMTFPGLPENEVAQYEAQRTTAESTLSATALEERLSEIDNVESQHALKHSVAGRIGTGMESVTQLAGFDWRTNIALVGGFAAKEVIVSTLGTAYSLGEVDAEESEGLSTRLAADPTWSVATAVALLVFVMLYAPCFVTVVVIARETSWKWATFSVVFNTGFAFVLSVIAYQFTRAIMGG